MSQRYLDEMKRYYYITPTSYLNLMNTFKRILDLRINQVLNNKNFYYC